MNNTSTIFSGSAFSSLSTMLKMVIHRFVRFIIQGISFFRITYQLINPFYADWTLLGFVANYADQLRAPLVFRRPFNSLFFHIVTKLYKFRLVHVWIIYFAFRVVSKLKTSCSSALRNISSKLTAVCRWMYSNLFCNEFLFHTCLKKSFNLISLYQTELCVVI
jgi:hypothetical protein